MGLKIISSIELPQVGLHADSDGNPTKGGRFSDLLPNNLKSLPLLGAEKLVECNRDIWSLTLRFFEKEIQNRRFFIVLFLHYKTRWGTLGNFSKVAIDFVTSSAGGRICRVSQRLVITVTTLALSRAKATRQPIAGRKSL